MSSADHVEAQERSPLAVETDERAARADWRSSVVASVLSIAVVGVWLIVSTAVFSYDRPAIAVIWGAAIIVIALLRLIVAPGSTILALVGVAAGVLTALTAFAADETAGPTTNVALMGAAVVVLSLVGLAAAGEAPRRSRP